MQQIILAYFPTKRCLYKDPPEGGYIVFFCFKSTFKFCVGSTMTVCTVTVIVITREGENDDSLKDESLLSVEKAAGSLDAMMMKNAHTSMHARTHTPKTHTHTHTTSGPECEANRGFDIFGQISHTESERWDEGQTSTNSYV